MSAVGEPRVRRFAYSARRSEGENRSKETSERRAVEPLLLDVADASSIKNAESEIATKCGYLDVLVNNAGINYDTWETVESA